MATALMASCSATAGGFLRRSSPSTPRAIHAQIGGDEKPPSPPIVLRRITTLLKPAAAVAMGAIPMPAIAAEIEKAALFDFNLTLPAIALEFLLLMVALDKLYFTPLGKFMDERDASIRAQLGDVKDVSGEVRQLEEQAAAVLKAARAEVSAALNQMKKETTAELEASFAEQKKKVEEELEKALAALENQKEETLKSLDSQIDLLSAEIVTKGRTVHGVRVRRTYSSLGAECPNFTHGHGKIRSQNARFAPLSRRPAAAGAPFTRPNTFASVRSRRNGAGLVSQIEPQ